MNIVNILLYIEIGDISALYMKFSLPPRGTPQAGGATSVFESLLRNLPKTESLPSLNRSKV